MLKKITFVVIILLLTITAVSAGNNTTSINNPIEQKIDGHTIQALESGDSNISFENGFKGYCVEWGEHSAEQNDTFYIKNTSYIVNKETNKDVSNYLKTFFLFFYNETQKDPIATQHMIWKFTDNKQFSRFNQTLYEKIVTIGDSVSIPDKVCFKVDDKKTMIFEFKCFVSKYIQYQNYFAYRIYFEEIIPNNTIQINNSTINNNSIKQNYTNNKSFVLYNQSYNKNNKIFNITSTLDNEKYTIKHICGGNILWTQFCILLLSTMCLIFRKK